MKKIHYALKNIAFLAILISSFIACDKDFATVGSDIIGQNNFETVQQKYEVIAYTNKLEPVQTNNLPLNYLGAYNDPIYGLTTASFVSQVGSSSSTAFGSNVQMDSVVLTIPYFSQKTETLADGSSNYTLDSIYGSGVFDLDIYENKYFLSSLNPNSEFDTQLRYFSNMSTSNSAINPALLEGTQLDALHDFKPSKNEIIIKGNDDNKSYLAPSLRVKLDTLYWREKIIEKQQQGGTEFSNANNFNNYFRGIYFKATPVNGNGTMALLNFGASQSNITIYYSKEPSISGAERTQSTYVLTFTGNRVNFLNNQYKFTIPEGNTTTGDEKLYLKGGEGSIAVVDLFSGGTHANGNSPEYTAFKNDFIESDSDGKFKKAKRLVNEANLVFYVDQTQIQSEEPNRIYLYDIKNGTPLLDYLVDVTNATSPNFSKINHLGVLQREGNISTGKGIKYKIKITEHINNLLLRDSTNVKLGLAVSGNVNLENTSPQFKLLTDETVDVVNKVPVSSILTPRGTVLYGNNTTNEEKKLYLEIFYTEPNN